MEISEESDGVAKPVGSPPLSELQKRELDRRLDAYNADPDRYVPWEEAYQRLTASDERD